MQLGPREHHAKGNVNKMLLQLEEQSKKATVESISFIKEQ